MGGPAGLVAALLLAASTQAAPAARPSAKARVAFVAVPDGAPRFEVPLAARGGRRSAAVFEVLPPPDPADPANPEGNRLTLPGAGNRPAVLEVCDRGTVTEAGTVELDGKPAVFFLCADNPMSMQVETERLYLAEPGRARLLWLELAFSKAPQALETAVGRPKTWGTEGWKAGRAFLEAVKYDYGYEDAATLAPHAPERPYAPYFWAEDNSRILALLDNAGLSANEGKGILPKRALKARRYEGRGWTGATPPLLKAEGLEVYKGPAEFDTALVAYDASADEEFILFDPGYRSAVRLLRAEGPYAFFAKGAGASDLLVIDLRSRRVLVYGNAAGGEEIASVEPAGGRLRLPGGKTLPFPRF